MKNREILVVFEIGYTHISIDASVRPARKTKSRDTDSFGINNLALGILCASDDGTRIGQGLGKYARGQDCQCDVGKDSHHCNQAFVYKSLLQSGDDLENRI